MSVFCFVSRHHEKQGTVRWQPPVLTDRKISAAAAVIPAAATEQE